MKVLMVGPGRKDKGGIATVVNQYYDAGIDKIVDIKYITTMHDGCKLKKLLSAVLGYFDFLINVNKYDVIHVHMSSRASFSRKRHIINWAYACKKKIIIHMHGSEFNVFYNDECNDKKKELIRDTFEKADIVIALSEEWKQFFDSFCDKTKVRVLYNAVTLPTYRRNEVKDHNILFLGRLGTRKGFYDLLEVMPIVLKKIPDVHLYFGGDGDIEETLKRIEKLGIKSSVTYLGWVSGEKKENILKECSVFVLPSYHEGMPMSILEAMSYGEVVVSTYVGGIPKVITNNQNGFLFNAGDLDGLTNALIHALIGGNKNLISKKSFQTIEQNFNVKTNIKILKKWYDEVHENKVFD